MENILNSLTQPLTKIVQPVTSQLNYPNTLLCDKSKEDAESTSDRVVTTATNLATDISQHAVAPGGMLVPTAKLERPVGVTTEPAAYIQQFQRMVFLTSTTWQTGTTQFSFLDGCGISEIFKKRGTPQETLKSLWKYYRAGYKINVQCNAPTGATGSIVVFYVPHHSATDKEKFSNATVFNLPHVIMNIATTSEITLEIPFVYHSNFIATASAYEAGWIYAMVLSPYSVPSGMNNTIDVCYWGALTNLEMTNPWVGEMPQKSSGPNKRSRSTRFKYTLPKVIVPESIGSANIANASTTGLNISSALAGERIFYDRTCTGQDRPIRDFMQIARIWACLVEADTRQVANESIFSWQGSTTPGGVISQMSLKMQQLGNLSFLSEAYKGWNGTIEFEFSFFASIMHKGRVAIIIDQAHVAKNVELGHMNKMQYTTVDIGLNSTVVVTAPFMRQSWMEPVHNENIFRITILCLNRLSYSQTARNTLWGMIRVRAGNDFKFFFPKSSSLSVQMTSWGSEMDLRDPFDTEESIQDAIEQPKTSTDEEIVAATGLADAGNGGDLQSIVSQPPHLLHGTSINTRQVTSVSYTDLFLFFGRAWYAHDYDYTAGTGVVNLALSAPKTGHASLMHCFMLWAGELNVTVSNESDDVLGVAHTYDQSDGDIEGFGMILVPPRQITTFTAPFYSLTPVRALKDPGCFGYIYLKPGHGSGSFRIWLSMRNPNFFFARPFTKKATTRNYVREPQNYVRSNDEMMENVKRFELGEDEIYVNSATKSYNVELLERHMGATNYQLLNQSGDIETNPGPEYRLCYQQKALYKHYGVTDGEEVIHLNTDDILASVVRGTAKVMCSKIDSSWIVCDERATSFAHDLIGKEMKFDIDSNCETFARCLVPFEGYTQSETIQLVLATIVSCSIMSYTMMDQDIQSVVGQIAGVITDSLESGPIKKILWFLLRCILYTVMFSQGPCLVSGLCLGSLIFMDIRSLIHESAEPWVKGFVTSAIKGDMYGLIENLSVGLHDGDVSVETADSIEMARKMTDQGIKDFNEFSNMFKNLEWWLNAIKKIIEWIKQKWFPDETLEFNNLVKKNNESIARMLSDVSDLVTESKLPGKASCSSFRKKYETLREEVMNWSKGFSTWGPKHPLTPAVSMALRKLENIDLTRPNNSSTTRVEPVGCLIRGEPGQGKSFFSTAVVKLVSRHFGWPQTDVYNHAVGSEHFDGYNGQKIHVIDDLGQDSSDEEYKLLCQCISTINFVPPMARIEDKGVYYTSEVVLCTTNRGDNVTKTLNSSEALSRRFPIDITIRAKQQYKKDGVLDITNHFNSVCDGIVWEDLTGQTVTPEQVAKNIIDKLEMKHTIQKQWNTFVNNGFEKFSDWVNWVDTKSDELIALFEPEKVAKPIHQRFLDYVKEKTFKFGKFLKKNSHWFVFISSLSTVVGVVSYLLAKKFGKESEQSAYSGFPTVTAKKTLFKKKDMPMKDQSPLDELQHLKNCAVRLVADGVQIFGLSIGGDRLLTYAHSFTLLNEANEVYIVYKTRKELLKNPEFTQIQVSGNPTDLAIVKTNAGFNMVDGTKYITSKFGTDSILFWNTKNGYYSQEVGDLITTGCTMTVNGTWSHDTVTYKAQTGAGTCGGLLCTKIAGNYHIVGMHIAGNGMLGRSIVLPSNQGAITLTNLGLKPVNVNTKTNLMESPLYGIVQPRKSPAPLTDYDPRLVTGLPSQQIFKKNIGNTFKPDMKIFEQAMLNLKERFVTAIGVHQPITIQQACFDLANPIDMKTSPGHKYTSIGLRKHHLIEPTNRYVNPDFQSDVENMLSQAAQGFVDTYFSTAYKDELRKNEKVAAGEVRVIEASNFDYTVAVRMIFGPQLDLFCKVDPTQTGVAVGINPYKDWNLLVSSLHDVVYDFDYKGFDGSLSAELMLASFEVLSELTTEKKVFLSLADATIFSKHHFKFDYLLDGSNPSGSPFTTILNCTANLLVVEYYMLIMETEYMAVTYGDDLVLSLPTEFDVSRLAIDMKETFGMTITPADKGAIFKPSNKQFSFLKRTTKWVTNDTCVGILDVDEMLQNIMWCRGPDEFKQQLDSFQMELALHGKDKYDQIREMFLTRNVVLLPYEVNERKVYSMIYGI